jgi:hypothetical protein
MYECFALLCLTATRLAPAGGQDHFTVTTASAPMRSGLTLPTVRVYYIK